VSGPVEAASTFEFPSNRCIVMASTEKLHEAFMMVVPGYTQVESKRKGLGPEVPLAVQQWEGVCLPAGIELLAMGVQQQALVTCNSCSVSCRHHCHQLCCQGPRCYTAYEGCSSSTNMSRAGVCACADNWW
jgi:hypothetical protein